MRWFGELPEEQWVLILWSSFLHCLSCFHRLRAAICLTRDEVRKKFSLLSAQFSREGGGGEDDYISFKSDFYLVSGWKLKASEFSLVSRSRVSAWEARTKVQTKRLCGCLRRSALGSQLFKYYRAINPVMRDFYKSNGWGYLQTLMVLCSSCRVGISGELCTGLIPWRVLWSVLRCSFVFELFIK